jgi:hypothetical protein
MKSNAYMESKSNLVITGVSNITAHTQFIQTRLESIQSVISDNMPEFRASGLSVDNTQGANLMIFYMQLQWNIEGRLKLEEVCDLERSEKARPPKTGAN